MVGQFDGVTTVGSISGDGLNYDIGLVSSAENALQLVNNSTEIIGAGTVVVTEEANGVVVISGKPSEVQNTSVVVGAGSVSISTNSAGQTVISGSNAEVPENLVTYSATSDELMYNSTNLQVAKYEINSSDSSLAAKQIFICNPDGTTGDLDSQLSRVGDSGALFFILSATN